MPEIDSKRNIIALHFLSDPRTHRSLLTIEEIMI